MNKYALPLGACLGAVLILALVLYAGVDIGHRYVTVSTNFATATVTKTATSIETQPENTTTRYATQPAVTVPGPVVTIPGPAITVTHTAPGSRVTVPGPRVTTTVRVPQPAITITETVTETASGFNS